MKKYIIIIKKKKINKNIIKYNKNNFKKKIKLNHYILSQKYSICLSLINSKKEVITLNPASKNPPTPPSLNNNNNNNNPPPYPLKKPFPTNPKTPKNPRAGK